MDDDYIEYPGGGSSEEDFRRWLRWQAKEHECYDVMKKDRKLAINTTIDLAIALMYGQIG